MEAIMFSGWIYDRLKPHAAGLKVAHPLLTEAVVQELLLFYALPNLFDGESILHRTAVKPLVAYDFPSERVWLPFDICENFAHSILGCLFVLVPLHRIGPAPRRDQVAIICGGK